MLRADLRELTDEDLAHASSPGLVKRAHRDLDDSRLTATITESQGTVTVQWSDDIVCAFPPASSFRGKCSCAATEICRHLIRSILFLQRSAPSADEPVESTGPTAPESLEKKATGSPRTQDLCSMSAGDFEKAIGKAKITKAWRALAGEGRGERVEGSPGTVLFPGLGVELRFPPAGTLETAICTCRERSPCSHVVMALLTIRGDTAPDIEPADSPSADYVAAARRAQELFDELLWGGLDGISTAWSGAAETTALEIRRLGLDIPAELLERIAKQIESRRTHDRPFDPARFRGDLASLWLRLKLFAIDPARAAKEDLVQSSKRVFLTGGKRRLVGIGARDWQNDTVRGLSCFLLDEDSGEIVTIGTARPLEMDIPPAQLARRAEILGDLTCADLLGYRVELERTRVADGRVRLAVGDSVPRSPTPVDWPPLLDAHAVTEWSELTAHLRSQYPTFFRRQRMRSCWLRPTRVGSAQVDTVRQAIVWPMFDSQGSSVSLVYRYQPERADAFEALRQYPADHTPVFIFGELRWNAGQPSVEPITLLAEGKKGLEAHVVDLAVLKRRKVRHGS